MFKGTYQHTTLIKKDVDYLWRFFSSVENLTKITSFPKVEVTSNPLVKEGKTMELQLHFFLFRLTWMLLIKKVDERQYFIDEAIKLPFPFKKWVHTHTFIEKGPCTIVEDKVEYEAYFPPFIIRLLLNGMFSDRARLMKDNF